MKKIMFLFLFVLGVFPCFATTVPAGLRLLEGSLEFQGDSESINLIHSSSPFTEIVWENFTVDRDKKLSFQLPSDDAIIIIHAEGKQIVRIAGNLECNGRCILLTPKGLKVENSGFISCGEFINSTLSIDKNNFFNDENELCFSGTSKAPIINLGKIYSNNHDLLLAGRKIISKGELISQSGTVAIGANKTVSYKNHTLSFAESKNGRVFLSGKISGKNVNILSAGKNKIRKAISLRDANILTGVLNSPSNEIYVKAVNGNVRINRSSLTSTQVGLRDNQSQDSITILGNKILIKNNSVVELYGQKGHMKSIMIGKDLYDENSPCSTKVFIGENCRITSCSNSFFSGGHICIWSKELSAISGFLESSRRAFFYPGGNILVYSEGQTIFSGKIAASIDDKHQATCSKIFIGSKLTKPIIDNKKLAKNFVIQKDNEYLQEMVDSIIEE